MAHNSREKIIKVFTRSANLKACDDDARNV